MPAKTIARCFGSAGSGVLLDRGPQTDLRFVVSAEKAGLTERVGAFTMQTTSAKSARAGFLRICKAYGLRKLRWSRARFGR